MKLTDNTEHMVSAKLAFFQLTMLMIGISLLVDAINGFFLVGIGVDLKLSAAFKMFLLLLVLYQIGATSQKVLAFVFSGLLCLLIGPIITFTQTVDPIGFIDDFTSCLKIVTAFIIFIYVALMAKKWPDRVNNYGALCLKFSFFILLTNLVLGLLGFGFSSYGDSSVETESDESNIGIKGFFYAGNEVSGIFIILFAWALHSAWRRGTLTYVMVSLLAMGFGVLVATKAAMISSVLLVFAIPLLNERNRIFNLTWLKVKTAFPIIIVGTILAFILIPIFESTGLLGRFMWFYEKKGVIGIILSGRDEFIVTAMNAFMAHATWIDYIFGFSKTGLGLITKNAMEIDPIDMYLWHGLMGLFLFMLGSMTFLRLSYLACLSPKSVWGPAVFIINLSLIAVSFIAGHIFTSGMLAPLFGLVNGLAYLDYINIKKVNNNKINSAKGDAKITRLLSE